jgi:hypothetical protein
MFETDVTETSPGLMAEVERWLSACQAVVDESDKTRTCPARKLMATEGGRRFLRIVAEGGYVSGPHAWAFIDMTNGDVLRADGWKRPDNKPRGNLYDSTGGMGRIKDSGPR